MLKVGLWKFENENKADDDDEDDVGEHWLGNELGSLDIDDDGDDDGGFEIDSP